ncbi:MAG: carotenoid biosynthesis protein [Actinomycetota bacterium]
MIVLRTIGHRWYAFAFLIAFFWAASAERSWKRALRFIAISSGVSLAAEYVSTHWGFPYGRYDYIATTHGRELYISNVPLFVPISFGTVVWAGRALANRPGASRTRLIWGGALFAAAIDLIIDPITLRGGTWFIGPLYSYRSSGPWFSVPWSNYAGWIGVAVVILLLDSLLDTRAPQEADTLRGPSLAYGMCAFFIVIALATRHWAITGASILVTGVLVAFGPRVGASSGAFPALPGSPRSPS